MNLYKHTEVIDDDDPRYLPSDEQGWDEDPPPDPAEDIDYGWCPFCRDPWEVCDAYGNCPGSVNREKHTE